MPNLKVTAPRIAAFVAACLIPLVEILLGIILILGSTIVNISFVLTFILIPVCTVVLAGWLIFSDRKLLKKSLLVILVLFVSTYAFVWLNGWGYFEMLDHYEGEDVSCYESVNEEFSLMPKLADIGEPEKVEYYDYYSQIGLFFTCDADALICQYTEADYMEQMESALNAYDFQEETRTENGYTCEPDVEIDGYHFRMLADTEADEGNLYYPKRLMFVATNDETREIVYLSFYDYDLDYIGSLREFLLDSCGWKYMR